MRAFLLFICLTVCASAQAQASKTSIGFVLSPNFSTVRYTKLGSDLGGSFEEMKSATRGSLGLSGSVFFQYEISDKFLLNWGLGVQNYRYQLKYTWPQQNQDSSTGSIRKYSQHYLQLQVSAKYRIYKTLYVRAGIGADLLAEERLNIYKTSSTEGNSLIMKEKFGNSAEGMFPVVLGVGYELKLSKNLHLLSELFGTTSLTNALEKTPSPQFEQRPIQLGISLGLMRSF